MATKSSLAPRNRPMEVLVLGLCRTGTMSTKAALEKLGYENVYHMSSVFATPGQADKWTAAMEAKFSGKGSEFTKAQFDDLLGDYDVVSDIPAACFIHELITVYPTAKIILTTRSPDSWFESMKSTIWATQSDLLKPWDGLWYNPHIAAIDRYFDRFFDLYFYGDFEKYGERVFVEHEEMVRGKAPMERFLEFNPKEGWGPLCGFLGKEVPQGEFPRVKDAKSWRATFKVGERWVRLKKVGAVAAVVIPVVAAAGIMWKRASGKV